MLDTSAGRQVRGRGATPVAAVAALLLIAFAGYFATVQNLWIDESTQLFGSSVPFGRMLRWLVGGFEPFGVPGDRMPPVSYMIDWACGRLACAVPLHFRILHLIIAATGVFLTARLAGRRHGPVAGIVAGLFLALLPQTVLAAAEIRAYPMFLALTALQLVLLYRLFDRPLIEWRSLLLFTAVGLLSIYTHFFGLVASSAMFCGLIVARARSRRGLLAILACWIGLLALSAGLLPFVTGAQAISAAVENHEVTLDSIVTYFARILGSAPMLIQPEASILFYACFALLLVTLLLAAARAAILTPVAEPLEPEVAVIVAIVAGLCAAIVAACFVQGFNPMKPSYSVWLLPPLALLAGAAAARGRIAAAVAAVMLIALLPVQATFLRHADLFVHGPERAIDQAFDHDPRGTAIVYVGPAWAYAYFPLIYAHGDRLGHYLLDDKGEVRPLGFGGDPNLLPIAPATLDAYRRLLIVEVGTQTGGDLKALLRGKAPNPLADPLPLRGLPFDGGTWRPDRQIVRPGLYWLRLTRLEKK